LCRHEPSGSRAISTTPFGQRDRRRRWPIWLALAIVLLAIAGWYALTLGGELSIVRPGRAEALLAQIEDKAALPVQRRGEVERAGPDGPMPEIAGRRLIVAADAATIRSRVGDACRSLGIAPADTARRATEPDVLCDGGNGHDGDSVHLTLSCDGLCTAYIQTQIVGF
jgi:hypothetical protein